MTAKNKRLIVVLGMHRSGTSAITRGLQVMGVELGKSLLPPQQDNVTGFWEDTELNALNMEMLEILGTKWHSITPLQDFELTALRERGYLARAVQLLDQKTSTVDIFGFKDPRTAKLLSFWKEVFASTGLKTGYVVTIRNPLSVYKSLEKRRGLGIEQSSLLWLEHTVNSLAGTIEESRVLVDYDRLMNDPEPELRRVAEKLDLEINSAELEKFKSDFLNRELQHTSYQINDLLQNEKVHPLVKEIYSRLLDSLENDLQLDDEDLEKQFTQWQIEFSRLRPLLAFAENLETNYGILMREKESLIRQKVSDIQQKDSDIRQKDADIQRLLSWLKNSETALNALIHSNRWRIGNRIGEAWIRLRGKPREPLVTDYLFDVFNRLHEWEHTRKGSVVQNRARNFSHITAEIVVCVHNALEDVKACLDSIQSNTDPRHGLILVDDGSNEECREYLTGYASRHDNVTLIRNESARGYTIAANQGLRQSRAGYVILLNSDTVVTPYWLENILECAESSQQIGIVGPLSNAASWQSVPELFASSKDWSINPLPAGWDPRKMAELVASSSRKEFPRVPLLNGFCLAIKRIVIEQIGYLDEQSFPEGYGEENDFCIRAVDAGFELAVADHVYIYHSKSKSYTHDRRLALSKKYGSVLISKHDRRRIDRDVLNLRQQPVLQTIRDRVNNAIKNRDSKKPELSPANKDTRSFGVLFVLPVPGWGGGIHSIIQEAAAMRDMGANAKIAVRGTQISEYESNYPNVRNISELLLGFNSEEELIGCASEFNVVVGTIYHSMELIDRIVSANPNLMPAYYIQDYEPWFFERDSKQWKQAHQSYTLVKDCILFAKTNWLCELVKKEHRVGVEKVLPSLDHSVYYPLIAVTERAKWPVRISAMIRPSSPRRAAQRTMQVLKQIKQRYDQRVEIHLFGCKDQDFVKYQLEDGFEYLSHGELIRENVAGLLRQSDIFVDFSDYQAFGRTGIEAMACGCAVILPQEGGVHDFAVHLENALVVDTGNKNDCLTAVETLIEQPALRRRLQENALQKVQDFSPLRAARSELDLLTKKYMEFSVLKTKSILTKKFSTDSSKELKVTGILSRTAKGFVGSAYIRLIQPLTHPSLQGRLAFLPGTLSDVSANPPDVVVVQRIAISEEKEARELVGFCTSNNIKLIYEVDDDLFEIGSSGSSHPEAEKYAQWIRGAKILALNADLVTVSSENLKLKLSNLNPNIHVLPNALDERIWQIGGSSLSLKSSSDDQIGVLYMGTKTHNQDLEIILEALSKIKNKYRDRVRFDIIGVSSDKLDSRLFNVVNIPPDTGEYPEFVRWLVKNASSWAIGLAPLVQTSFNECKSYIKFLDYSALGLASICSRVVPYESIVTSGNNGLLVENTTQVWYETLERLLEESSFKDAIRQNARLALQAQHTLKIRSATWWETYASLFDGTKATEHNFENPTVGNR